ncbi:hypothetical protein K9L63_03325 [Candidatus Gracilibacteria bacterium]|nr:hypothetical protein [Candidatus Gracilibacteria bacterium]
MKRIVFLSFCIFLLSGCGQKQTSQPEELTPEQVANMTEEEKEAEIAEIFARIGVELPENWSEMSKQERGKFILQYGLGASPESVDGQ